MWLHATFFCRLCIHQIPFLISTYIYRKKNETIISFEGGENTIKEARAPHLRGKNIVIADSNEDNEVSVYWDKIFLPE